MSTVPEDHDTAVSSDSARATARMETRDYVWKYWSFHADQRLKTFNFFILFTTVLVAGSLAYLKDSRQPYIVAPCGLLMTAICWLFWRLDCRNRELIRHAEGILKQIEREIPTTIVPGTHRLFCVEESETGKRRRTSRWFSWYAPLSFYSVFRLTFGVFGTLGLLLFVGALLVPGRTETTAPSVQVQNFDSGSSPVGFQRSTDAKPKDRATPIHPSQNNADPKTDSATLR